MSIFHVIFSFSINVSVFPPSPILFKKSARKTTVKMKEPERRKQRDMGPRGHGEKWGRPKRRGFKQEGPKKGARGRRA